MPNASAAHASDSARPLQLLIIDDSPEELELMEAALDAQDCQVVVHTTTSWDEAHVLLAGDASQRPDLILVDVHMPGADGFDILRHLKADPALRFIPVVIRGGSGHDQDVMRAYDLKASAYLDKPSDFTRLQAQMNALLAFWSFGRTLSWPPKRL